jgi:hypothetical protein
MKRKVKEQDLIFKPARIDEHTHQSLLIQWSWNNMGRYPELQYLHAIPNGAKLPYTRTNFGHYSKQAMILKSEGLKRGVPDLCLPYPRAAFHGLYIEMKALDGEPSDEQIDFVDYLNDQGFLACFAFGCDAGITIIEWYLNQPKYGQPINGQIPTEAVRQITPKPGFKQLSTQF